MGDVTGPNDGEEAGVGLALLGLPSAQYHATLGICYYRDCVFLRVISERPEKLAVRMKISLLLIFYDSISLSCSFFLDISTFIHLHISLTLCNDLRENKRLSLLGIVRDYSKLFTTIRVVSCTRYPDQSFD